MAGIFDAPQDPFTGDPVDPVEVPVDPVEVPIEVPKDDGKSNDERLKEALELEKQEKIDKIKSGELVPDEATVEGRELAKLTLEKEYSEITNKIEVFISENVREHHTTVSFLIKQLRQYLQGLEIKLTS